MNPGFQMAVGNGVSLADSVESRRLLVERVASSRHVNRSARLRDMLLYVSGRVLDGETDEIHEQEVGHRVFGRPANYDTASDNIVRVHASMLRKRLEQYFASEGSGEPFILEIPKGNYAPVFRERIAPAESRAEPAVSVPPTRDWRMPAAVTCAILFACSTAFLLIRPARSSAPSAEAGPVTRQFWSQIFPAGRSTDIVLDDAAVGLFQELSQRSLTLSDYFDRGYLRNLPENDSTLVLHRHSSASSISLLWRFLQIPGVDHTHSNVRFARDYSFRELKADNVVLLGNARFNPWIEPFFPKLGIRWVFDQPKGVYNPVDSWGAFKADGATDTRGGYCSIALVPNLGGNGSVLILSGTGGSALNGGGEFLANEHSLAELRGRLPATGQNSFPYFEALINIRGRSTQARDTNIVLARAPRL
jgi:hypothetical protein